MTASEMAESVRKLRSPLLEGLASPEISTILAAARQQHFRAKSVITNQGRPASHMFMVLNGGTRSFFLTQGGQQLHIHRYPPGEMFGGMALLSRPSNYLVSTEAVWDSDTLVWERVGIRNLAVRYPKLLDNALTIAADYFNASLAVQISLSCHTARQRLAEALLNLASGIGHRISGGIEVVVRNEELAAAANVTPFTASRVLNEWERSGLVTKSRGRVLLPSPERLLLHDV